MFSENIRKTENEVAVMGMIAEFLVQKKYEKAKDHLDEEEELEVEVSAAWDRYTTNIHDSRQFSRSQHPSITRSKTPPSHCRFKRS